MLKFILTYKGFYLAMTSSEMLRPLDLKEGRLAVNWIKQWNAADKLSFEFQ
jgi:hypothetical protein